MPPIALLRLRFGVQAGVCMLRKDSSELRHRIRSSRAILNGMRAGRALARAVVYSHGPAAVHAPLWWPGSSWYFSLLHPLLLLISLDRVIGSYQTVISSSARTRTESFTEGAQL